MNEILPTGKNIGSMQASLNWIHSHTVRFKGIVRIRIQEGEGFILIEKGSPRAYYFRQSTKELKGKAAKEYFGTRDTLDFELFNYNSEEFRNALKHCEQNHIIPFSKLPEAVPVITAVEERDVPSPAPTEEQDDTDYPEESRPQPPGSNGEKGTFGVAKILDFAEQTMEEEKYVELNEELAPLPEQSGAIIPPSSSATEATDTGTGSPGNVSAESPIDDSGEQEEPVSLREDIPPGGDALRGDSVEEMSPVFTDADENTNEAASDPDTEMDGPEKPSSNELAWILRHKGVIAAALFIEGSQVLSTRDAEFDHLGEREMEAVRAAVGIASASGMGAFVQMTLQVPSGYAILTPYREGRLFVLTTKEIHIGQIRAIVREALLRVETPV